MIVFILVEINIINGDLVISEAIQADLNPTKNYLDKINPDKSIRISRELFEEKLKALTF